MPDIVITPASNLIDSTGGTFTIRTADAQALSLKTNNSDALYIKSDGNIGIGTTSPAYKLEVSGTGYFLNNLTANGVTIGSSDIRSSSNILTLGGTSEIIRITGGNVGIGTTSPAYKLDVSPVTSTVRLGRVLTGEWPTSANYALFGHAVLDHTNSGNYALLQGSAGDTFLNAASGQPIYFRIANADKMILASGGNVGIGTTNPTQKLEVRGYVLSDLGAGVEAGFYLGNSGHGTRRPAGTNDVYLYTSAGTVYLGANGNSSQHVTVTNSGNVGIGTTSPAATLHVTGAVRFASLPAATGANVVYIASNGDLTSGAAPAGGGSSVTLSGPNNGIVTRDGAAGTTLIAETNYEFNASTRLMYLSGQIGINFTGNTGSATPLEIHGTGGELFSIDDDLSSSLMSVNTIAGLPVFEAFADSTVQMGQYGSGDFIITGNKVGIGYTTPSTVNYKLDVTGTVRLTGLTTNTTSYTSLVVGTSGEICSKVGGAGSTNIFVGAGEMIPRSTGGAGVNSLQTGTNNINYDVLEFDASTAEYAQFIRTLPNNWNLGTITAKFYWTIATTSAGNVVWGIRARSYPDNSALDQAFGTAVTVTDGALTAAYTHISSATSAMTIGGTNALGNPTIFEIYRDAANGSDTLAIDAQLLGLEITYN